MKKMTARFKNWFMRTFQKDKWEAIEKFNAQKAELRKITGEVVHREMMIRVDGGKAVREAAAKRLARKRKLSPVKVIHVGTVEDYSHQAPNGQWKRVGHQQCGLTWSQHPELSVYVMEQPIFTAAVEV